MGNITSMDKLKAKKIGPDTVRRFISGDRVMMAFFEFEPNATAARHKHPHEQIGYIVRGRARVVVGDEEKELEAGGIYVVPPNVEHYVVIGDEPALLLDAFSPPREDFIEGE
ncbi:MAG: cupin domain-containing protein [bacterium]